MGVPAPYFVEEVSPSTWRVWSVTGYRCDFTGPDAEERAYEHFDEKMVQWPSTLWRDGAPGSLDI